MEPFLLFCGLLVLAVTLFWFYGTKNYNYWQKHGVYAIKPFFPFFGNVKPGLLFNSNVDIIRVLYESLSGKPYGGIYFLTTPAVVVRDLEIIKNILVTDFNYFVDRGFHTNPDKDPLSNNLIHLGGKDWKFTRSKLQASFRYNNLKSAVPEMDNLANEVLEQIIKDNTGSEVCFTFNATDLSDRYMMDVIAECALGVKSNAVKLKADSDFYKVSQDIFGGFHFLIHAFVGFFLPELHKLCSMSLARKHVTKFFVHLSHEILSLRKSYNKGGKSKCFVDDLIKMTIDDNELNRKQQEDTSIAFDEEFVAANIFMFYSAGYDSSAKICTFALSELAYNEEIQNKAREEVMRVLTENNGEMTLEAVQEMTYLEQIVAETNRKYPILPVIFRKCVKQYKMPDGGIIEPGIPIIIPSSAIHFNPAYFPNPHIFDPERFNDENKRSVHISTYLPFGAGPRICVALKFAIAEIKVMLARILSKYHITLHPSTNMYPIKLSPRSFLLRPEKDIYLNAKILRK